MADLMATRWTLERQTEEDRARADLLVRLSSDLSQARETLQELRELAASTQCAVRTSVVLITGMIAALVAGGMWWFFHPA